MGMTMLYLGIQNFFSLGFPVDDNRTADRIKLDVERGKTMLILGTIMILPGSYGTFMLFMAYRGYPGYSYEMVPSYDD